MRIKRKVRVLIIDDSVLFREILTAGLGADPAIEIVGTAADVYTARDKIIALKPDVLILDVEMPKMNGIEFLKKLIPQYPIPVVVVSAFSETVFDALKAGAIDFVSKVNIEGNLRMNVFINELATKVKIASNAKIGQYKNSSSNGLHIQFRINDADLGTPTALIAMGASTGGTEALAHIIEAFPKNILGTVVVQHMPPVFTKMYAERLNKICEVEVREAQDGDRIYPGTVLIAPGDHHIRVIRKANEYWIQCFKGEKVNGHCPSVDVLFHSVAEQVGRAAIGVILTGMGCDGAKGLLAMRQKGARTIGQNKETSIVYGMPKVAYEIGGVEKQYPLKDITSNILSLIKN